MTREYENPIDDFVKTVRKDLEMHNSNKMVEHLESGFKVYFQYDNDGRISSLILEDADGEFLRICFDHNRVTIEGDFVNKNKQSQKFILRFPFYKWKHILTKIDDKYVEIPNVSTKIIGYKELLVTISDDDIHIF